MPYFDLTKAPNSLLLPSSPAGYWLIVSFEMVLRSRGETVFILTHPSYISDAAMDFRPGMLCPPFVAFPLNSDARYLTRAGDIQTFFREKEEQIDLEHAISTYLYLLGLTSYKTERVGEVIEYKESNREPGKHKCYKVIRYSVASEVTPDLINLADPLTFSKFLFLPLPDADPLSFLSQHVLPDQGINFAYKGIPLTANLCRILEDANTRACLAEHAMSISDNCLYHKYEGILIKCDIQGSGVLTHWLLDVAPPFEVDNLGLEFAHEMAIHTMFLRLLAKHGFPHVYLMGDGFIAGRPCAANEHEDAISDLSCLAKDLANYCSQIRPRTRQVVSIDYRLAVQWAEYAYGRFNLLNDSCYFMYPSLVTIARMEEGLKRARKRHLVPSDARTVVDQTSFAMLEESFRHHFNVVRRSVNLRAKESSMRCVALRVKNG